MNTSINRIFVTLQKEGIHCFPAAALDAKYATGDWDDVSFLASPHRHIFHIKVEIDVYHNDRDIEFIQFKRWLERALNGTNGNMMILSNKSCEMIADDLAVQIAQKYPHRNFIITVSEDGENGCVKGYDNRGAEVWPV
jgi:hypothetical protein